MVVDNIYLEDLIQFQKIEFTIKKGYYWTGKRDYRIQEVIKNIFNKRLEYKKEGNPLEQIYKLVMNSPYGKTIEKAPLTDILYIDDEFLENYWRKNYCKISEDTKIDGSTIHAIRVKKQTDKHFNFALFGIHILSMSKRIMNEVMTLAEDINCDIYYQDTDSMFVDAIKLPKLKEAYKDKYGRELSGKQMGQFESDFTSMNGRSDVQYAS